MNCPMHGIPLQAVRTRFGVRRRCPCKGCTVVLWDGPTSTPADKETREWRQKAHAEFDAIWKGGHLTRAKAYRLLSRHLGIPFEQTHIGMFSIATCRKTVGFSLKLAMEGDWKK